MHMRSALLEVESHAEIDGNMEEEHFRSYPFLHTVAGQLTCAGGGIGS